MRGCSSKIVIGVYVCVFESCYIKDIEVLVKMHHRKISRLDHQILMFTLSVAFDDGSVIRRISREHGSVSTLVVFFFVYETMNDIGSENWKICCTKFYTQKELSILLEEMEKCSFNNHIVLHICGFLLFFIWV